VNEYEILLLLDPDVPQERHEEILARTRELIEKDGGEWKAHEPWGRRKLAYEINSRSEGVYHLIHFTSDPPTLDEITRVLKITDGVMRFMATRRPKAHRRRPVAAPARQAAQADEYASEPEADSEGGA